MIGSMPISHPRSKLELRYTVFGRTAPISHGPRTGSGSFHAPAQSPTDPTFLPALLIVADPNGCGKSTLARMSRFSKLEVIDPDAIARDMPPGKAAREALRRRRLAFLERRSFLVETTLSGTGIFRLMEAVRKEGYMIVLHYVSLGSPEQALDRIRNRVARGGHDVPEHDVRRRFSRSHANFPTAVQLADEVFFYDNSLPEWRPRACLC